MALSLRDFFSLHVQSAIRDLLLTWAMTKAPNVRVVASLFIIVFQVWFISRPTGLSLNFAKIGMIVRDAKERMKELSTGTPQDWEVATFFYSIDHVVLEQSIHQCLFDYRYDEKKELFKLSVHKALEIIKQKMDLTPDFLDEFFLFRLITILAN